jgi:hypothetical protein
MIGARRRQNLTSSSICSTCTTGSSSARWSDVSSISPFSPTFLSPQRPVLKSVRRFIIPLVPPAWSPSSQVSPQAALRDFCVPRQEPRPPADVLKRSPLCSCSPSLAKFSRTSLGQHVSISTSTTTLPSAVTTAPGGAAFLHPTMNYLTVSGLKTHHHRHQHYSRNTR